MDIIERIQKRILLREAMLERLEWSGTYSYCTGWPCCPICKGIKPGYGKDERGVSPDNSGHRDGCELASLLSGD